VNDWGKFKARLHEEFQLKREIKRSIVKKGGIFRTAVEETEKEIGKLNLLRKVHAKVVKMHKKIEDVELKEIKLEKIGKKGIGKSGVECNLVEAMQIKQKFAKKGLQCDIRNLSLTPAGYYDPVFTSFPQGGEALLKPSSPYFSSSDHNFY
jgi:hypothetical protein